MKPIVVVKRPAGFGSNFLQALDWWWYSEDTGVPVYIDWNENGRNIFDDFFEQKHPRPNGEVDVVEGYYGFNKHSTPEIDILRYNRMSAYKKYNKFLFCSSGLYHESTLLGIRFFFHQVMKENLKYSMPMIEKLKPHLLRKSDLNNCLGVHSRFFGHYFTKFGPSEPLSNSMSKDEFYSKNIEQIKQRLYQGNYGQIYLACDDAPFFDECVREFGDILLHHQYTRTSGDWMTKRKSYSDEMFDALVDILNLTACNEMVGCVSNFTFMVLVFQPFLRFQLFNTLNGVYTG